jgi:hypothetical protein
MTCKPTGTLPVWRPLSDVLEGPRGAPSMACAGLSGGRAEAIGPLERSRMAPEHRYDGGRILRNCDRWHLRGTPRALY